jgi:cadmium resistance protein CadD (predicted permease)
MVVVISAIFAFVATNLDDLALLIAWYSDRSYRSLDIAIGQLLGMLILTAASASVAVFHMLLPLPALGAMGVIPILIGMSGIVRQSAPAEPSPASARGIVSVAVVTIANGGDNIATYAPLLATKSLSEIILISFVFMILTVVWIMVARLLVTHPAWRAAVNAWGHRIVPWILVVLGIRIIVEARTAEWLWSILSAAPTG